MFRRFFSAIGRIFGFGTGFDPTPFRFPELQIDSIASDLNIEKRGLDNGNDNVPSSEQISLSAIELEIVENVGHRRNEALNKFEIELETYATRIESAKGGHHEVELLVGKAENELKNNMLIEENHLQVLLDRVEGFDKKLKAFQKRHKISGPPRDKANIWFTIAVILGSIIFESILNGYFFATRQELGYLGGIMFASIISIVNVGFAFLFGIFSCNIYMPSIFRKFLGIITLILFFVFAMCFLNPMVAHFRDVLVIPELHEELRIVIDAGEIEKVWNTALRVAWQRFEASPFGMESSDAWLLFSLGSLVSLVAFLKGHLHYDKYLGYNRVWDDKEKAIDSYASAYEDAQYTLEKLSKDAENNLRNEANRRRVNVMNAVDAVFARSGLIHGLDVFLDNCNQGATRLLRIYREANQKSRTDPPPKYFLEPHAFSKYDDSDISKAKGNRKEAEVEIKKIEKIVNDGVDKLLVARRDSLKAFPTVKEIRDQYSASVNISESDGKEKSNQPSMQEENDGSATT